MSRTRRSIVVIALALLGAATARPVFAGDPTGIWLTKDRGAKVRVADCGGALCGTIVWLQNAIDPSTGEPVTDKDNPDPSKRGRPLLGVSVIVGMKPSGTPGRWTGHIYNADNGKTYRGSILLQDAARLKVEGCLLVFCGSETWSRTE
jgi:uncharacterized protein (DUF2147 family)